MSNMSHYVSACRQSIVVSPSRMNYWPQKADPTAIMERRMSSLSVDANDDDAGDIKSKRANNGQTRAPATDANVQTILEALPEPIYMTDASGRITFYNS